MAQLKHRLIELISEKQVRDKRTISQIDIARATGIHPNTIRKWMSGDVTRFDDKVVVALLRYFDKRSIADLLYVDWNGD